MHVIRPHRGSRGGPDTRANRPHQDCHRCAPPPPNDASTGRVLGSKISGGRSRVDDLADPAAIRTKSLTNAAGEGGVRRDPGRPCCTLPSDRSYRGHRLPVTPVRLSSYGDGDEAMIGKVLFDLSDSEEPQRSADAPKRPDFVNLSFGGYSPVGLGYLADALGGREGWIRPVLAGRSADAPTVSRDGRPSFVSPALQGHDAVPTGLGVGTGVCGMAATTRPLPSDGCAPCRWTGCLPRRPFALFQTPRC